MRAVSIVVCTVVLAIVTLGASIQTIDGTSRGQAKLVQNDQMILEGPLDGPQQGTLRVTLKWDGSSKISGTWRLSLQLEQPDGSFLETGALSGIVADGSLAVGPDGVITGIDNFTVTITEGSGDYSSVTAGGGRLDARLTRENEPFTTTFSVTF